MRAIGFSPCRVRVIVGASVFLWMMPSSGARFYRTVQDIKEKNADSDPDELQRFIDGVVIEVRAERRLKNKLGKD